MINTPIFVPYFNKCFKKFLKKYDKIISYMFNILKQYKPKIIDSYVYTLETRPHPLYKYTDKLYLACILHIMFYSSAWCSFLGPIPGDQVSKRHLEYCSYDFYKKFFDTATIDTINEYERKNKNTVKHIHTDTTVNNNKLCKEINKHYPCNKNRKGMKVSFLINNYGIILAILMDDSTKHDSKFGVEHINEFFKRKRIMKLIKKHNNKLIFFADSAYDTHLIRETIKNLGLRCIIKPNNKNTKDPKKKDI